ncbi:MAG: hypothetical protein ACREPE_02140 [Lysobacter sp.]
MNAMLSTTIPLPAILDQSAFAGRGRRHRIENYCLAPPDVERFNNLLQRLGRRQPPLDRDQIVSAARELCDCNILPIEAPSIHERMRRVETAVRMVDDAGWEAVNEAVDAARLVIDYTQGSDDLIPDWVPKVGRLDDAIVIDAAWPRLADEIESYLDFCRLRDVEAGLRDCCASTLRFNRADWEQLRREEAALAAHQRDVREHSYLPGAAPMFRVH